MMSEAVKLICRAEGVAADRVEAVRLVDDDIEVKVANPSGGSRLLVYPLAALRGVSPSTGRWGAVPSDGDQADAVSENARSKR